MTDNKYSLEKYRLKNDARIYHFRFKDRVEMNKTFCRFSEFVESPTLKKQNLTHKDILKITPDYYNIVLGHNIPDDCFKIFIKNISLNEREKNIFNNIDITKSFSVIASYDSIKKFDATKHEFAHAFYALDNEYKIKIDKIIKEEFLSFKSIENILKYKQYDKDVWQDETHAALLDLSDNSFGFFYGRTFKGMIKQLIHCKIRFHFKYRGVAKKIKIVFNTYYATIKNVELSKEEMI